MSTLIKDYKQKDILTVMKGDCFSNRCQRQVCFSNRQDIIMKKRSCQGDRKSKERLTILSCTNSDG